MGFFFWFGLLITQIYLAVRALVASRHETFQLGVYAACARLVALVPLGVLLMAAYFPGLLPVLPWGGFAAMGASALMPLVSFVTIWKAHQRTQDAPAADEERASRPFDAWLPIAIVDAIMVVIVVATLLLLRPRYVDALYNGIAYI